MPVFFCKIVSELAVADWLCCQTQIGAGLIQCDGIKGCEHSEVRKDGSIVFSVAAAVGRNVHDKADVEGGLACTDCGSVFCHLAAESLFCAVLLGADGIESAGAYAASAALA